MSCTAEFVHVVMSTELVGKGATLNTTWPTCVQLVMVLQTCGSNKGLGCFVQDFMSAMGRAPALRPNFLKFGMGLFMSSNVRGLWCFRYSCRVSRGSNQAPGQHQSFAAHAKHSVVADGRPLC